MKITVKMLNRIPLLAGLFLGLLPALFHAAEPADGSAGPGVRARAEAFFSASEWIPAESFPENGSVRIPDAENLPGRVLPPQDGSPEENASALPFPVFPADTPESLRFPEVPGAGSLDFSGVPASLTALFAGLADAFSAQDFSVPAVASGPDFLAQFLVYKMERLPPPQDVWFAGIEISGDGTAAKAGFRIRFSRDGGSPPLAVFAAAEAVQEGGVWKLRDVILDGDSYGQALEQIGT